MNYYEPDEGSIFEPSGLFLTVEIQKGPMECVDNNLYPRYLEIMGHSDTPIPKWQSKEDFILMCICKGLGHDKEKLSDVINEALVAGALVVADFQAKIEKELGITERD